MKSPILLSVTGEVADFEPLLLSARARGVRLGWLEFEHEAAPPASLAAAGGAGAFRAVGVGGAATVAVKPMRGPAVLRDLLREHFLGADVVLVKGRELFPRLRRAGGLWILAESAERERPLDLEQLFARLRKPELRWRESMEGAELG